jgi:hypothetical protein
VVAVDKPARAGDDRAMHFNLDTALVVTALVGSIVLIMHRDDRLFPVIAAVAVGLEALMVFHIIALSSAKFRIDVILPAVLVLAGGMSWSRSSTKPTITAATAVTLVGLIELLAALRVFD